MYKFRQFRRGWERRGEYRSVLWIWIMWCVGTAFYLGATPVVLSNIPLTFLVSAIEHMFSQQKLSPSEIASILLWVVYGLVGYAILWLRSQIAGRFFQLHAFDHLYDRCRIFSPAQMNRARLSQVTVLHPELFSYAFSGSIMVLRVRTRGERHAHLLSENQQDQFTMVPPDLVEARVESEQASPVLEETNALLEQQEVQTPVTENVDEASPITAEPLTELQETISPEKPVTASQKKQEAIVSWQQVQDMFLFQIVIGQAISFYLLEEAGNHPADEERKIRIEIILNNSIYKAIIVYLATREKGSWVLRNDLLDAVYGDATKEIAEDFNDHLRKIRNAINGQIMKAFPHLPPVQKKKTKDTDKEDGFDLFENKVEQKKISYYRLNAKSRVTGIQDLLKWYQRIRADSVRPSKETFVAGYTIEALQDLKEQLTGRYSKKYLQRHSQEEGYSGGYLIQCLSEDPFRRWARDFFKETRTMYISVLKYIASCEEKMCMQTQKSEWAWSAAETYKECAYAATCDPVDSAQGEEALRKSIELYMYSRDEDDRNEETQLAQNMYDVYKRRVERVMTQWTPEQKTREVLDKYWLVRE